MEWLVIEDHTDKIVAVCKTLEGAKRSATRRFNDACRKGLLNDDEGFAYVQREYYNRTRGKNV